MFDFSYDFLFLCTSVLKWVRASLGFMCSADSRALCLPRTSPGNVTQTSASKIKFQFCRKFAQISILLAVGYGVHLFLKSGQTRKFCPTGTIGTIWTIFIGQGFYRHHRHYRHFLHNEC